MLRHPEYTRVRCRQLLERMVSMVREDITHGVRRLTRRFQDVLVIAVREHLAAAPPACFPEGRLNVPGRRDEKALHAPGKRRLVLGFDQQMHMIALQADVNDAKPLVQCCSDRSIAHRLVHRAPP